MSLRDWLRSAFGGSRKSEARCLACDSTELVFMAEAAYRCSSCGHEGGDGLPAWIAARKRAEIEALSPAQRSALARKQLEAARNLLEGIHVDVGAGTGQVAAAVVLSLAVGRIGAQLADDSREEEERVMATAFRELLESEQLLDQAAIALGYQLLIPPIERLANRPLALDRGTLLKHAHVQRMEWDRLIRIANS